MAAVVRDGRDARWLARWRDPNGRQHKKSFPRKIDAQRWLDQLQASAHRGEYIAPSAGKTKVEHVARGWATGLTHLKPSTQQRYRSILRYHLLPEWGGWAVGDIRRSDITAWIARLADSGRRPGTTRQIHRVLSLILDVAVDDGLIGVNPAVRVRLPRQVRGEPRFLSPQEVAALAAAAGKDGTTLAVLALTGLRFGELAALRVARIDLDRRRLVVAESVTEVGGLAQWTTPKTHQTRSVPFPPSLTPALATLCAEKQPTDLVFTAPEGGVLRLNNWRRRVFDPAAQAAGLVGIRPHDLRHTAASLAIRSGANPKAVQRMLGHASAAMTLDVYAGLFADDLDSVAVALDAFVPPLGHIMPSPATPDAP